MRRPRSSDPLIPVSQGLGSTLPVLLRKACSIANQPTALYFLWLVVPASNPIDASAFLLIFLSSKRLLLPTLRSHCPSPSSASGPGTSTSHKQKAELPVEKSTLHNLRLSLNTGYQHGKKHCTKISTLSHANWHLQDPSIIHLHDFPD